MVLIFTVVREDANIGGNGCRVHRTFLYIFFITSCESVFKNEKLGKKKKLNLSISIQTQYHLCQQQHVNHTLLHWTLFGCPLSLFIWSTVGSNSASKPCFNWYHLYSFPFSLSRGLGKSFLCVLIVLDIYFHNSSYISCIFLFHPTSSFIRNVVLFDHCLYSLWLILKLSNFNE